MTRLLPLLSVFFPLLLLAGPATDRTPPREGKVLKEIWEAAHIDGIHVGHIHRTFREVSFGERKLVEGVIETDLSFQRFGQPVRLHSIQAMHEDPRGQLQAFILREGLGGSQTLVRKGKVIGNELLWTVQMGDKPASERRLKRQKPPLGLFAQEQLLPQRPPEAPARFDYERFEPVFDSVLAVTATVGDWEDTSLLGPERKRLRRVTLRLDPQATQDAPPETLWVDEAGECWKRHQRLPLLGNLTSYRVPKESALPAGAPRWDVGKAQLVAVTTPLPRGSLLRSATYRLRLTEGGPLPAWPSDETQTAKPLPDGSLELRVHGLRQPAAFGRRAQADLPEYLQSNAFITADDPEVRRLAQQITRLEGDPWRKAIAIERWVHGNMRSFGGSEGFATASEVVRSRRGDCKAHAVLAAALCRAAGVPARIAIGLIYVPREQAFGFHMWLEVNVDGEWYGLDPTLGQGRVAADRLKILDHHLNGETSFSPLLPVAKLTGRLKLEQVATEYQQGIAGR